MSKMFMKRNLTISNEEINNEENEIKRKKKKDK